MSAEQLHAVKNQALYWKAFAGLAVHGKRDAQAFQAAMIQLTWGAPSDEDVQSIIREAQAAHAQAA